MSRVKQASEAETHNQSRRREGAGCRRTELFRWRTVHPASTMRSTFGIPQSDNTSPNPLRFVLSEEEMRSTSSLAQRSMSSIGKTLAAACGLARGCGGGCRGWRRGCRGGGGCGGFRGCGGGGCAGCRGCGSGCRGCGGGCGGGFFFGGCFGCVGWCGCAGCAVGGGSLRILGACRPVVLGPTKSAAGDGRADHPGLPQQSDGVGRHFRKSAQKQPSDGRHLPLELDNALKRDADARGQRRRLASLFALVISCE